MKNCRVVIADDSALMLRLMGVPLTKAGFNVFTCADGDEAMILVQRHRPVILLADWNMPGITGPQLCRQIRQSELGDDVYAILITGNSRPEEIAIGLDAGANDYLVKPVDTTVLLARVRAGERVLQLWMRQREYALSLESEIAKRKRAEDAADERSVELERRTQELEKSRQVALGMMEDAERARKAAEAAREALRGAKDYTENIISSMIDMLVVVAPDRTIRTANEATCKALGYRKDELIGKPASVLFSEEGNTTHSIVSQETLPFQQAGIRHPTKDDSLCNLEKSLRAKNGHTIPVLMSSSVMHHNDGTIRGIVLLAQDITERKRLETELLESNSGLLAINDIHQTLFACQSVREVAMTLTESLVRKFDAYFARVWLIRRSDLCSECALSEQCFDQERCLHLVASSGHYTHIDGDHRRVPLGAFKVGLIAHGRGKTICNDVVNDERVHNREWAAKHGLRSFAGLPLTRDGKVIGVMAMFSKQALSPHLLDTLDLLAELGSTAVTHVEKAEALRDSEETFRCISTSAQDAIIMMDGDGNISFWNEAAETIFGYSREEVVGKHLHSAGFIVPKRFQDAHFRAWPEFQKTGRGAAVGKTVELVGVRKNGEEFPVEISLSAANIEGRWHAIGMLRDITKRKIAETKLRKLSVAVEQSPVSIVITDTQGTIEYVNPMFTEVTGYTADEVLGRNPRILKSGKWTTKFYQALWDKITSGKTWTGEFENKKKNGETFWEAASISPVRNAEGAITHFLAVKQDITERKYAEKEARDYALAIELANAALQQANTEADAARKRAEQTNGELESIHRELVQSHDRINQLIEAISSVLIGVNAEGEVIAWNGRAEQVFGIDKNDAVGRLFDELVMVWNQSAVKKGITECRVKKHPVRIDELRFKRPDGTEGFLGVTLNPVNADEETYGGFLLLAADITDHKILQSQLVQAQKLESIGQLAAGIAHEINTPIQYVGDNVRFLSDAMKDLLSLIQSYRELISEIATDKAATDCVGRVATMEQEADLPYLEEELPKAVAQSLDGVDRVSKIVRAMKDFSHPGAEGKEAVDLNKAIESTITVARNEWKYVAEMVTDFDPALPFVPCLVSEFNQVVLNIVINAAHAIADVVGKDTGKKGTITVATRRQNDWAEVRISDTGTGIKEEHRRKVFDPFFTTKEVGRGTGQGLAIAHSVIADKHGGSIHMESEIGKGTTFIIRLPMESETAIAKEATSHEKACSLRG